MQKIEPQIRILPTRIFAGICLRMTFADYQPGEVWKKLMPRRGEIGSRVGTDLYSIEVFPKGFLENYSGDAPFEKWAAVEVASDAILPEGMQSLHCPEGLYAIFRYKGPDHRASEIYTYIYREWLPASGYVADDRPHFAVMGAEYKRGAEDSEEDICVPIRQVKKTT
jgi:AraC family transcriptional regulator